MKYKKIRLGICNTYLLGPVQKNYVLIDAGNKGFENKFFKTLTSEGIQPKQISHILITHAHHDHIGGLNLIKANTGAQVIVHEKEAPIVRQGIITIPKGVNAIGKITSFLGKRFLAGKKAYDPIEPDIVINNSSTDLEREGFPLHLLHTPGHTAGSISVFDPESARLFCGDAAFNLPLLTFGKHYPPFADIPEQITKSWQKIIATGATHCYPGHGKAFPASSLAEEISKK